MAVRACGVRRLAKRSSLAEAAPPLPLRASPSLRRRDARCGAAECRARIATAAAAPPRTLPLAPAAAVCAQRESARRGARPLVARDAQRPLEAHDALRPRTQRRATHGVVHLRHGATINGQREHDGEGGPVPREAAERSRDAGVCEQRAGAGACRRGDAAKGPKKRHERDTRALQHCSALAKVRVQREEKGALCERDSERRRSGREAVARARANDEERTRRGASAPRPLSDRQAARLRRLEKQARPTPRWRDPPRSPMPRRGAAARPGTPARRCGARGQPAGSWHKSPPPLLTPSRRRCRPRRATPQRARRAARGARRAR